MDSFTTVLSAYAEVGILGLLAILMIILFYKTYERDGKRQDRSEERIDKKDEFIKSSLLEIKDQLKTMNELALNVQREQIEAEKSRNEALINAIINGVTSHVPSTEENFKLTSINRKIDLLLKEILDITNADRVFLVQYHNGGKGVNKQSFLKMSMTNEQIRMNMHAFMPEFKDQFRSVLGYFVQKLDDEGYCYINDFNDLIEEDIGMYEYMRNRGITSKYGYAIKHATENYVIAFICVEYESVSGDKQIIDNCFKEYHRGIEVLLNS